MKTSPPGNGVESTFSRSLGKWDVDPTPWLEVSSYARSGQNCQWSDSQNGIL